VSQLGFMSELFQSQTGRRAALQPVSPVTLQNSFGVFTSGAVLAPEILITELACWLALPSSYRASSRLLFCLVRRKSIWAVQGSRP
jgi:hypothetical protein